MDGTLQKYILMKDRVGEHLVKGWIWNRKITTQLLRGEIFKALPESEQPKNTNKIALAVISDSIQSINLECRTLDVSKITNSEADLLLAISSVAERFRTYRRRNRLAYGKTLDVGHQVFVELKDPYKEYPGVIWYKGHLPTHNGIMFGVELLGKKSEGQGKCDGTFRNKKYFNCPQNRGVFVALDKLHPRQEQDKSLKYTSIVRNMEKELNLEIDQRVVVFPEVKGDKIKDQRVVVFPEDNGDKIKVPLRGTVRYISKRVDSHGDRPVGIELDKRKGSGTGVFNIKQRFVCKEGHTLFVPVTSVLPEEEYDSSEQASIYRVAKKLANPGSRKFGLTQEDVSKQIKASGLEIGSMVEVPTFENKGTQYGVIRWIGQLPEYPGKTVAGLELETEQVACSDGIFGGRRYFTCPSERAFFVNLQHCRKDSRFQLDSPGAAKYSGKGDTIPSEILARGPEALKAYEKALESGKTKNRRLPVMVVGPARAGKTSLLKSLNGEKFDQNEDSTDGIHLQHTFCKSQENCWSKESDEGISFTDCMADIIHKNLRGENDSKEIHDENTKNDEDDRDEDNDADDDDATYDDDADDEDVGKIKARKVDSEEINEEAKKLENREYISEKSTANLPKSIEEKLVKLMDSELSLLNFAGQAVHKVIHPMDTELSDKTKENEVYIKSLDFGGQAVYNVIHPIFLTSKAVFILVYNLKNIPHDPMKSIVQEDGAERELVDPFEMTNLENLELWLSGISSYTDAQRMAKIGGLSLPPVFIVGTHADKFDGNLEAARQIIREIYKSLSPSKNPSGCHVISNQIYTVNNSVSGNGEIRDESVRKLKADIEELSKSLPHMNDDIPINWLWFEEELSNLVEKENKKYITLDEALKIANECKVNTSAESKEFPTLLNYLHDLKTIIYFEETKKVFIDTEWLVKVFTKVIEVRPVEKRDGFHKSWDKLEEEGVMERALVEHVWKGLVDEQNTIDSLVLIMEKFSLICRWNTSEGEEVYLVPCMLCNSEKREDIAMCLRHQKSSTMVIRFNTSHVSLGIFPRLFVAIAAEAKKRWPKLRQPKLYKNFYRIFDIGKERKLDIFVIQSSIRTISVTVSNQQNIDGQHVTEFCQHFRKLLDQIFVDMRRNFPWMQNMPFEYGILCPVCASSPNKCKFHGMEGCNRDSCLHFVNEEELIVDRPRCDKNVAILDNVIKEEAYTFWFPRQVFGMMDGRRNHERKQEKRRTNVYRVAEKDEESRLEKVLLNYVLK